MLLGSWINSLNPCHHGLSVHVPIVPVLGWPTTKTGWHPHGRIILHTSFFSASSAVEILWWALICSTKIFVTIHLSPICLFPKHSCPWSNNLVTSRPLINQLSNLSHSDSVYSYLDHFSLHAKWIARCFAQSSAHWGNFLSLMSFRVNLSSTVN